METLIAILHIGGAVIATMALGTTLFFIGAWMQGRSTKHDLEEASLSLGVPVNVLDDSSLLPKLIQYSSSKFSSDLLRNRISDFLGILTTIWNWLGLILEIGLLAWIVWITLSQSLDNAIYAWSIVGVALFFSLVSSVLIFFCKVLTGRYPGQARQARKVLVSAMNSPPT